ncbi:MFS transporter [Altererythrobacter lutimaris]|uniref:MFS transporter n=1 Tax=Altererythrobacter lutimaris TaxID=2743979 RepID=A0A850HAJ7_9SPHN|nr:MFS transporter [Altererythrobacter lutimaris]NVE95023.1 MFS transporter [Altererythrobacter lutimaris]
MTQAGAERGLILSENKIVRLFSFFFLYFGQGLPVGITVIALPAWLAANGAPDADVAAVVAMAYLPWSFKWIPAAIFDRYAYLAMGRRRAWLIFSQGLMIAGFVIAAVLAPGVDDIDTILVATFLIMGGAASQDVAVDGLAVDILPEKDQGTASSFMFGGQTVARAVAGAASGFGLQYYGSQATFLAFIPVILIITAYACLIKERPGEKRFPWNDGEAHPVNLQRNVGAWWPIFKVTVLSLLKRDSLVLITASSLGRTAGGMLIPLVPILAVNYAGYDTASYSGMISTVDLAMAIVAIGVGSFLTIRFGPKFSYAGVELLLGAAAIYILVAQGLWVTPIGFIALACVYSLLVTLSSITSNPLRMQLSDERVAATQFTIYNSLSNLPVSLGATIFAWLGGADELAMVLGTTAALYAAAVVFILLLRVGGRPVEAEPEPVMN